MKCSSCGTEIEDGAARCPQCGADMGGNSASRAVRLKTNRSILLYVIFGMLPVVMGIIPLVYILLR
ncbi:MAG: zinc ribbon domain-containing protein [Treponemataceae bacterium]|nr:zinc ribbon domain-containing protein [Treponemataceae bacterium]